jgi:hypothetical protein
MSRWFVVVLFLILTALSASSGARAQQLGPSFWKDDCALPWGGVILGGQTVTAYESATATCGCVSETRTCAGNYLDGSYTNQSCVDTAVNWTARSEIGYWEALASSADGMKLVAALTTNSKIATSTDGGVTWTERSTAAVEWRGVASSSDGVKLVAVALGDKIYTSTNSGVNWTARDSNRNWEAVASSSDGVKLVAVTNDNNGAGEIYTSTNSGVNWTARGVSHAWTGVASSSDGTKLVAVENGDNLGGKIYTSTNSGVNWTARESDRDWRGVASSSDGTKLVAVANGDQIYTSTNSGVNWTARESARDWWDVASSSDGTRLVAIENDGQIYTSADSGVTWTAQESVRDWRAVASSANGRNLVAAEAGGGDIYTGNCAKTVFVTSTSYNGNLGGTAGADAKCAARATAAGLDGTYLAWISSGTADDPATRFPHVDDRYILTTGTKIADDWTDLTDGTLDAGINRNESAGLVMSDAWTGISTAGVDNTGEDCTDWTNGSAGAFYGKIGSTTATDSTWTVPSTGFNACSATRRIYCFQTVGGGGIEN